MANSSLVPSACIFPFLAEADFPAKGGHVPGRFCQKIDLLGGASCCLPCPETDWVYGDRLNTAVEATNWVAVVGLLGCAFLLGSYAVLPVGRTHRYYLSTCVTFATALMMLAFVVPLGSRPDKCFDAITPHDMKSDTTCAASGFFLLYGGFTALMWVFLRALDLYLQICWQVTTGRKFVILAHVLGWGLSAAIVTGTMVISGMSYRLGTTCVPNHQGAVKNFWAPAFVVAGITALLQFSTMSYCMKVFVSSRLAGGGTTVFGSRVPIIERGMPAAARNSYNRVRQIIKLQWRPFGVVVIIVTNVIVSSVIFVLLDGASVLSPKKAERQMPWYVCLALSQGDQEKCRPLIKGLALDVSMAAAVLFVLALNGISCFAVLSYWTMFTGWTEITWKTLMRREDTWSPPVREGSGVTSRVEEKTPSFAMESPSPVAEDRAEIVTITRKPAPLTPLPVSRFSFGPATPSTQPAITSPKSPSWESTHSSAVTMTPASPVREFPPARETFNAPAPFPEPLRPRDTTYAPRDQAHGRQRPRSSSRGPPVPPKPEGYTPGRSPTSPEGGYSAQRFL